MNSRGQLWSLDLILAAAIFTLALGVILSQSELQLFYGQQDRITRDLQYVAWFDSSQVASKPDLFATTPLSGSAVENIRCGPHTRVITPTTQAFRGWGYDNELSPLENCLINTPASLNDAVLGALPGYSVRLTAQASAGGPPAPAAWTMTGPPGVPTVSVSRRLLVLPEDAGPVRLRTCLDGGCGAYMTTADIAVWRS